MCECVCVVCVVYECKVAPTLFICVSVKLYQHFSCVCVKCTNTFHVCECKVVPTLFMRVCVCVCVYSSARIHFRKEENFL